MQITGLPPDTSWQVSIHIFSLLWTFYHFRTYCSGQHLLCLLLIVVTGVGYHIGSPCAPPLRLLWSQARGQLLESLLLMFGTVFGCEGAPDGTIIACGCEATFWNRRFLSPFSCPGHIVLLSGPTDLTRSAWMSTHLLFRISKTLHVRLKSTLSTPRLVAMAKGKVLSLDSKRCC